MRVLITGSNGFIGRKVMNKMIMSGMEVAGLDKTYQETTPGDHYAVDLLNESALLRVMAEYEPEAIIHLAAMASVRDGMVNPHWYVRNNITGTINLLQSMRPPASRFVFAASGGTAYGNKSLVNMPFTSNDSTDPEDTYGITKVSGESFVKLFSKMAKIEWFNLRLPNVYGPGQSGDGEAGVVAIFAKAMLSGRKLVINGDGEQTRDFAYVTEVADWFVEFASRDGYQPGVYNVGSGNRTSVNQIMEKLVKLTGYTGPIVHGPPKNGEVRDVWLDVDCHCHLVPLDDGLQRTVDWFKKELGYVRPD